MCCAVAVDHPAWWVDGRGADKTLSDRSSPLCTPRPWEKTRLLSALSPSSEQVKIGIVLNSGSVYTAPLCLNGTMWRKKSIEDNGQTPGRAHTHTHTHIHTKTVCVCINKKGLVGSALPVEPVVCVAWKRERVIAAEVIAGIRILKGWNGRVYNNNDIQAEKNKRRESREERFMVECWPYHCLLIWMHQLGAIWRFFPNGVLLVWNTDSHACNYWVHLAINATV